MIHGANLKQAVNLEYEKLIEKENGNLPTLLKIIKSASFNIF